MSYEVSGFIAKRGTFDHFKKLGKRISVAHLNDEFDMLLNDRYFRRALNIETDETFQDAMGFENWLIDKTQMETFSELSKTTPIVFFDATYVGGNGMQKALVWENGEIIVKNETKVSGIAESIGPINEALKAIGVVAEDGKDEFETVKLNRHRKPEHWCEEATGTHWRTYLEDLA